MTGDPTRPNTDEQAAEDDVARFHGDKFGRLPRDVSARLIGDALIRTEAHVQWTEALVESRLVQAIKLLDRVERPPGPSFKSGFMPEPGVDWAMLNQLAQAGELEKYLQRRGGTQGRFVAQSRDLADAISAAGWVIRYLSDPKYETRERQCLDAFLRSEVLDTTAWWNASGHPQRTAYRLKDKAIAIILEGVKRDDVAP